MFEQKQKTNESEKEISPSREKKNTRMIVLLSILGLVIILAASFLFWQKYEEQLARIKVLQQQVQEAMSSAQKKTVVSAPENPLKTQLAEALPEDSAAADDYPEEYKGWQTYTNFEAGYKLRHPATWKVREVIGTSQMFNDPVNYIIIDSPKQKYSLYWAMKNAGDIFRVSERTGIGVGENVSDGKITILGNEISINPYVNEGKADEILYPSFGTIKIDGGKREITADFSSGPGNDVDIRKVPERAIAEKILRSVRLVAQKKAECPSELTAADLESMDGWGTYSNQKYGFSFRYPGTWDKIVSDDADYVMFDDNAFQFRSGPMTATDFMGYEEQGKISEKVACMNASRRYFCGDPTADPPIPENHCMFMAEFQKNGVPHLITYSYASLGASLSGVYSDTFDLILKSLKFY
jgi:hypothetical protein